MQFNRLARAGKHQVITPPEVIYAEIMSGRETEFTYAEWPWVIHADNGGHSEVTTLAERGTNLPERVRFMLGTDQAHTIDSSGTERVEFEGRQLIDRYVTYNWSTKVRISGASPVDYSPYGEVWKGWMSFIQVHQTSDAGEFNGSPPLTILLRSDDHLVVTTRSDANAATTSTSLIAVDRVDVEFSKDIWHTIEVEVKFDKGEGGGYLSFTLDDITLFAETIPIGFNDTQGPYFKFGPYRNQSPGQTIVEFDAMPITTV